IQSRWYHIGARLRICGYRGPLRRTFPGVATKTERGQLAQWLLVQCHVVKGRQDSVRGRANRDDAVGLVVAWADAGRGERRALPASRDSVSGLLALPDGRLLVAAQDPFLELLESDGRVRRAHHSPKADLRDQYDKLAVSSDGAIIDFGFEQWGKSPL